MRRPAGRRHLIHRTIPPDHKPCPLHFTTRAWVGVNGPARSGSRHTLPQQSNDATLDTPTLTPRRHRLETHRPTNRSARPPIHQAPPPNHPVPAEQVPLNHPPLLREDTERPDVASTRDTMTRHHRRRLPRVQIPRHELRQPPRLSRGPEQAHERRILRPTEHAPGPRRPRRGPPPTTLPEHLREHPEHHPTRPRPRDREPLTHHQASPHHHQRRRNRLTRNRRRIHRITKKSAHSREHRTIRVSRTPDPYAEPRPRQGTRPTSGPYAEKR